MQRPVRDFMTKDVSLIRQEADVHELEKLFVEQRIHGVPVVDDDGRLVGVVSQSDLIAWHYELGLDGSAFYELPQLQLDGDPLAANSPEIEDEENEESPTTPVESRESIQLTDIRAATVAEVMTPLVHAIRPESSAAEAAARMLRHRIHRLVVVDAKLKVLGIVCAMDLLALVPGVREAASRS